ncbi:Protein kinase domain-containing protein [Forsythia ovata]|uniref:Protein kinase domain-containing protein n=1 Tax=Forsythia ovata TaxID=205694 RepID=A0ABD1WRJ2_9LAMI
MVQKADDLVIIGISVGLAVGILIASLVFFAICWYKKRVHLRRCANERSVATLPIRTNGLGTVIESSASIPNSATVKVLEYLAKKPRRSWWNNHGKDQFLPTSGIPRYSYKDIQKATQNFTTILGQGSFGPVYKATMPAGEVVAVKVLASSSKQGEKEFHTEAVPPVIHRDLKSANILLDRAMRAKVADFGLSKEEVFEGQNSGLKGTYGYIDPVYISTNKFTTKSDIYSFGVILFELITGIHPSRNLMEYVNLRDQNPIIGAGSILALLCLATLFICFSLFKIGNVQSPLLNHSAVSKNIKCNYTDGRWIYDTTVRSPPRYNPICKEIYKGWNCLGSNKSNALDIVKWRWKPYGCDLPQFDPLKFLQDFRDTNIGFKCHYQSTFDRSSLHWKRPATTVDWSFSTVVLKNLALDDCATRVPKRDEIVVSTTEGYQRTKRVN